MLFLCEPSTSICHFFCPSIRPSIHCTPYLRNHTSSNHNFWCTFVKWWYLQVFFSFFFIEILILKFWLLRGGRGGGLKGKKLHKMKNDNYICHATYLRNNIVYHHGFWYTCVKWWYVQVFFLYFHFLGCYAGKRAKNCTKWKMTIISVMQLISGTI